MRVLVACERSGVVRRAFAARGHEAWSCDLADAEDGAERHLKTDARRVLADPGWDLVIAHPPCTRLALSGLRWLEERNLWADLDEAARFFDACWNLPAAGTRVCVENPKMHRHAQSRIAVGREDAQWVDPWWFGDGWTKRTGLWLRGLPPLIATGPTRERNRRRILHAKPGPERTKERARTPPGLAEAMAEQWGCLGPLPH